MAELYYPFTLNAKSTKAQADLKAYFDNIAHAEARERFSVLVFPVFGQPVPVEAVARVLPMISSMRSPYIHHLSDMVCDEAKKLEQAASGSGGQGAARGTSFHAGNAP